MHLSLLLHAMLQPLQNSSKTQEIQSILDAHPLNPACVAILQKARSWAMGGNSDVATATPLQSIFSGLIVNKKDNAKEKYYIPIHTFNTSKASLFPVVDAPKDFLTDWKTQINNLLKEYKHLPDSVEYASNFIFTLHFLIKKYVHCIPSDSDVQVNIWEQGKLTAAVANSLYLHQESEENTYPIQLVCVELSGVQKFIYSISSKQAAKSLRGRSYFLQAWMDGFLQNILQQTNTTIQHIVYSSGGKSFLLLPNDTTTNTILENANNNLQKDLLQSYGTTLYACIGKVSWKYDGDNNLYINENTNPVSSFREVWKAAANAASEQKKQRYKNAILENKSILQLFTQPFGEGGSTEVCSITAVELHAGNRATIGEGEDTIHITKAVKQQIQIGKELTNAQWHSLLPNEDEQTYELHPKSKYLKLDKEPCKTPDSINWYVPNSDTTEVPFLTHKTNVAKGFRLYGAVGIAMKDKYEPKSFEDLSDAGSHKRLAILRMDVDGLGDIFIKGLPNPSLGAYSTLSNQLDVFFTGYLNTIRSQPAYKDAVSIIYSGGDDVFAVGQWEVMADFANDIQNSFQHYTNRKDITISAGISLIDGKYPIAKGAEEAGEAEEKAKNHSHFVNNIEETKNALHFLGATISWKEYQQVKQWQTKLKNLNNGILYKIVTWYDMKQASNKRWRWHSIYTLSRALQSNVYNEVQKEVIKELQQTFLTKIHSNALRFEVLILATRWAVLENRNNA